MSEEMFTDEELEEAAYLEEAAAEKLKPKPKKMVKTFVDPAQFKKDIAVNPLELNNAFMNQAALFAHYGMQAARAAEQMENAKMILEVKEAQLYNSHREALTESCAKVTEPMVTNAVLTDPVFIKAKRVLNEAKGVLEMNKVTTEAFRQRRDMLIQIGADARAEKMGEMSVNKPAEQSGSSVDLRERGRRLKAS